MDAVSPSQPFSSAQQLAFMSAHAFLETLDSLVEYALRVAAGEHCTCPAANPAIKDEIDHLIATVRAAQAHRCKFSGISHPDLLKQVADRVPWSNRDYAAAVKGQNGRNPDAEDRLKKNFPPLKISVCTPSVIEDSEGQAIAYYLPNALLAHRQVRATPLIQSHVLISVQAAIADSMRTLAPTLAEQWPRNVTRAPGSAGKHGPAKRGSARMNEGAWRNSAKLFLAEHLCPLFGRGNVTASPAWHSQGHTVR